MLSWTLNIMDLESVERQNEYGANLQSITGSVAGLPHKTHTHRKMLRIKPYFFLISSSCFTHTPADFAHSISSAFFLSLSLFIHYTAPPPSGPVKLSSVCGGVSPVPPVLSLSRSIKRRRTHAGCLKSPPTLPYGWWTGRCSNHTQLYLGRRSILLICFCTPATGFPRSHED